MLSHHNKHHPGLSCFYVPRSSFVPNWTDGSASSQGSWGQDPFPKMDYSLWFFEFISTLSLQSHLDISLEWNLHPMNICATHNRAVWIRIFWENFQNTYGQVLPWTWGIRFLKGGEWSLICVFSNSSLKIMMPPSQRSLVYKVLSFASVTWVDSCKRQGRC